MQNLYVGAKLLHFRIQPLYIVFCYYLDITEMYRKQAGVYHPFRRTNIINISFKKQLFSPNFLFVTKKKVR